MTTEDVAATATASASAAAPPIHAGQLSNQSAEVLERARRSARKREAYVESGAGASFAFEALWDHILASQCTHPKPEETSREAAGRAAEEEGPPEGSPEGECTVCLFEQRLFGLPQLPEMIFPENRLIIRWKDKPTSFLSFCALDALLRVDTERLPNVQVAPSSAWQEARANFPEFRQFSRPFDWTFTTDYAGTAHGLRGVETTEKVDMERLKRQEPILFYAQVPLYEDELADHGSSQLSVRIRVMPSCFFVLQRCYLRVDRVMVRVCDTRVYSARGGDGSILVEWTMRESPWAALSHLEREVILDSNQLWLHLPVIKQKNTKFLPDS